MLVLTFGVRPAAAAITEVQAGTYLKGTNATSVTPTLASASTAGNLLVAEINPFTNPTVTAPTGWVKATAVNLAAAGTAQIWYYPNNPGGITSAVFSLSPSATVVAELSEWSGIARVSPLDGTGTNSSAGASSLTVTATAAQANELGITDFKLSGGGNFTPGSGWTNLFRDKPDSALGDYQAGIGSGSVSETETVTGSPPAWVGAIATFLGSCNGGSLLFNSSPTMAFGSLTLNGYNQSVTGNYTLTMADSTGGGAGWNLTGTSTTFKNASNKTLPTTATTLTAGAVASNSGTCVPPTNAIAYPLTLPAGSTAPTAVKLYDAAANTGLGSSAVTLTFKVSVPGNAYSGVYSSTWTLTLGSGP